MSNPAELDLRSRQSEALRAIQAMDGQVIHGRSMQVSR